MQKPGFAHYSSNTWYQHFDTVKQENGPKMITERIQHACGKLEINGETVLIVAGGKTRQKSLVSTEYLSLAHANPEWKTGSQSQKSTYFYFVHSYTCVL